MKRTFILFSALALLTVSAWAQTVSSSSVTVVKCVTTKGTKNITVPENLFPYEVEGHVFNEAGCYVVPLTNANGCDSLLTITVTSCEPGKFTVASGKQVIFSKGNLQFRLQPGETHKSRQTSGFEVESEGIWRFSEHQYDAIGNAGGNAGPCTDPTQWMDLFGYGTSGYNSYHPYLTTFSGYPTGAISKTNCDWGYYNAISNGGNEPGIWYCLTYEQWNYITGSRPNASSKWGLATIAGVSGIILIPDTWTDPQPDSKIFQSGRTNGYLRNEYSDEQWQAMELSGAIFIPKSGYWWGNTDWNYSAMAFVWTGTNTYVWQFPSNANPSQYSRNSNAKCMVRLVKDAN